MTKEELQKIVEEKFPDDPEFEYIHPAQIVIKETTRSAFIEGYEYKDQELAEMQKKCQGLVKALEELIKDVKSKPNDTRYATHIKKAEDALNSTSNE